MSLLHRLVNLGCRKEHISKLQRLLGQNSAQCHSARRRQLFERLEDRRLLSLSAGADDQLVVCWFSVKWNSLVFVLAGSWD